MIPSLLGNLVGGGLFVGVVYWYLFLTGDTTPIVIDGEYFDLSDEPSYHEGLSATPPQMEAPMPSKGAEHMV